MRTVYERDVPAPFPQRSSRWPCARACRSFASADPFEIAMTEQEIGTIELCLLGGVELRGIDPKVADRLLAQPKITALLAFLALSPEQRPQRRDRIVALLWPELDQAHARTALRKALHGLRAALGPDAFRNRGDEEVGVCMPPLWCDVIELAAATDNGRMMQAVQLYRGELMAGFHLDRKSVV